MIPLAIYAATSLGLKIVSVLNAACDSAPAAPLKTAVKNGRGREL